MEENEYLESEDWQERAVKRVLGDFERGKEFLDPIHTEILDRYAHYRSPSTEGKEVQDTKANRPKFPVPFTTEQVNTLKARIIQKLFFRNRPCSIYGQEKTDEADAEAKREMFEYQDRTNDIEGKVDQAITWAAIAGYIPAMVTFKKEMGTEVVEQPIPVAGADGPVYDEFGSPVTINVPALAEVPKYLGSHVELIDVFDYFFLPEKTSLDDEEPQIIRTRKRPRYFYTKDYFFNQDLIKKKEETGASEDVDKLEEKRRILGYDPGDKYFGNHCTYLEWQGYYDPGKDAIDAEGAPYPAGYYVIGVVTGINYEKDVLVRFDHRPFPFDGGNIIVGLLCDEMGEIMGPRFVDNFHAVQHAQDSVMGLWFAALKQVVKRPKVVNSDAIKDPNQINTAVDETIEVEDRDDVNKVIHYPEVPNISQDLYNGMAMLRQMGQNASKIFDQTEGIGQAGIETLGEANILAAESEIGVNNYIRTFERTFIKPMYEKRNAINAFYLPVPYVISVIGEKGLEWRQLTASQVRAGVDFVCEAATRENQRGVVAQQIIQTIQPMMGLMTTYAQMGYPPQLWPRVDLLMKELYNVWTWDGDKIAKMLPSTALNDQEQAMLAEQLQQFAMMQMLMAQQQQSQPQGKSATGARTPQPRNEGEAQKSASDRNDTHVARNQ